MPLTLRFSTSTLQRTKKDHKSAPNLIEFQGGLFSIPFPSWLVWIPFKEYRDAHESDKYSDSQALATYDEYSDSQALTTCDEYSLTVRP